MWLRAFTILFELRARVSQNLKTTIDINEYLGIDHTTTLVYQRSLEAQRAAQDPVDKQGRRNA